MSLLPAPATLGDVPVLVPAVRTALVRAPGGALREMDFREATDAVAAAPHLVCHAPWVGRRIGTGRFRALDILELFAFVRPAQSCLPTIGGLADALALPRPKDGAQGAELLLQAAADLLADLGTDDDPDTRALAQLMTDAGWPWGPAVLAALPPADPSRPTGPGFDVWRRIGEWAEFAPEPQPASNPVAPEEARLRLVELAGSGAEDRPDQQAYAEGAAGAFAPREHEGEPQVVIAEAGTGVGKTIGYIAPASLWAERNQGPVWVSTYTRNLQRQIDSELDRLYTDPERKTRKVVIRKGRENYLCLLNFEDATARIGARPDDAIALGLMARWALATRDGDMVGGDFPDWLSDLVGRRNTLGLADRRGECIYSACRHYHRCFIEKTVRRARRADIVVANHALVMAQAATGGLDDGAVPTRMVFDEGHHLFDAADSAFSACLSGQEAGDLRHWILGAEEGRRSRARGLRRRIEDIAFADERTEELLYQVEEGARALPGPAWNQRLASGRPMGDAEAFLALVRQQVYARAKNPKSPYDLEADCQPAVDGLLAAAETLGHALAALVAPMRALTERLASQLDERASELDTPTRNRIESVGRGLRRRAEGQVEAWRAMLAALVAGDADDTFVDWFAVSRLGGRDVDVGMHRHWMDPTVPFAKLVAEPSHGLLITSASLRDGTGDPEVDWQAAENRTGAAHLTAPATRVEATSPFDYAGRSRVLVITDVRKDNLAQVAAAYRELFVAADGGALGLFTAITRLRAVYDELAGPLENAGVPLFAQHVDNLNTTSLVDIFRSEEDACLLGTDAVRDGVDVPGRSLRLLVYDRVPWPRPSILHRARRDAFSRARYDDLLIRLRLKQAFGRLLRRSGDAGVFVMLDSMMPSRLAGAFPPGVEIERLGLRDAVAETRDFLTRTGMRP